MDEALKRDFEVVCDEMGLTMTTAFIVFAKAVTDKREMPSGVTPQSAQGANKYKGALSDAKTPRPGCMKGQIWMSDDFDEPLDDFGEYAE
jgi:addiction module RelB/DinJ family antitoxin